MAVAAMIQTTQHLTFKLGEKVYAVDISKVREVLDFTTVTKVPPPQSRFIRQIRTTRLLRFARKDGF